MKRVWKKLITFVAVLMLVSGMTLGVQADAASETTAGPITTGNESNVVTNTATVTITDVPYGVDNLSYATYRIIYATYNNNTNELTWEPESWVVTALTTYNWYSSNEPDSNSDYYYISSEGSDAVLDAIYFLLGTDGRGTSGKSGGTSSTEQNTIVNTLAAYIAYAVSDDSVADISQDGNAASLWTTTAAVASGTTRTSSAELAVGAYLVIPSAANMSFLNMLVSVDVSATPDGTSTTSSADTTSDGWLLDTNGAVLKGSMLTISKTVSDSNGSGATSADTASAQVGDTLYYTITVEVPHFADNDSEHAFKVIDTPTNLDIDTSNIIVVAKNSSDSVNEKTLSSMGTQSATEGNYYVSKDSNTGAVTIDFTANYYSTFFSSETFTYDTVVITYQATLTSNAVLYSTATDGDGNTTVRSNTNTAQLYYDYDNHTAVTSVTDETTVYTYGLTLTKYDESSGTLSDASFTITDADGTTLYFIDKSTTDTDGKVTAVYQVADGDDYTVGEDGTITGSNGETITTTITTGTDGIVTLVGLDASENYFIVETVAPSGYTLNTNILKFSITPSSSSAGMIASVSAYEYTSYTNENTNTPSYDTDGNATTTTWSASVSSAGSTASIALSLADTKISALPATGSVGIIVFTIAGVIIMILALVLINSGKSKQKKA